MKIKFILLISAIAALISCEKTNLPDDNFDCEVALKLVGEITTSESPLTKATGINDLYVIQVYTGSSTNFAFGIFDDLSYAKLNLKKGYKYTIKVCKVNDAKTLLGSYYSLTNGGVQTYNNYVGPFGCRLNSTSYFLAPNVFNYVTKGSYYYYSSSTATSRSSFSGTMYSFDDTAVGSFNKQDYPTCEDWFYGQISNYTPDGEYSELDIPMKRVGFKLKYELSGVTDGQVKVTVSNSSRTFINNTTTTSTYESDTQFIAFKDAYSAWLYADNYTENVNVNVTWTRGIGITQNLGTKTVQVKRNCLNNIKIKLGSDDRGAGVSLSIEDESSMGNVGNTIPVE